MDILAKPLLVKVKRERESNKVYVVVLWDFKLFVGLSMTIILLVISIMILFLRAFRGRQPGDEDNRLCGFRIIKIIH